MTQNLLETDFNFSIELLTFQLSNGSIFRDLKTIKCALDSNLLIQLDGNCVAKIIVEWVANMQDK